MVETGDDAEQSRENDEFDVHSCSPFASGNVVALSCDAAKTVPERG
jgi:hypothetical protein